MVRIACTLNPKPTAYTAGFSRILIFEPMWLFVQPQPLGSERLGESQLNAEVLLGLGRLFRVCRVQGVGTLV